MLIWVKAFSETDTPAEIIISLYNVTDLLAGQLPAASSIKKGSSDFMRWPPYLVKRE